MKAIGPTFGDEIIAAGLGGLPFTWGADGVIQFDPRMTDAQIAAVNATYAAHDPAKPDASADATGFVDAIKSSLGGIVGANALMRAYPAFYEAVSVQAWPDVQALITDAHTTGALSSAQYAALKNAARTYNIPVSLP